MELTITVDTEDYHAVKNAIDTLKSYDYKVSLHDVQEIIFRPSWKHGYNDELLDTEEARLVIDRLHEKFQTIIADRQIDLMDM